MSNRRRRTNHNEVVSEVLEDQSFNKVVAEEQRKEEAFQRKWQLLQQDPSVATYRKLAKYLDVYMLDPVLGLIPVMGDLVAGIMGMYGTYIALVKLRSIPLVLAMTFNTLVDIAAGSIPYLGIVLDFVVRSNRKNARLITGFIERDHVIINEINGKATKMGIGISIMCIVIYMLYQLAAYVLASIGDFFSALF